jgi:hypothetical protein
LQGLWATKARATRNEKQEATAPAAQQEVQQVASRQQINKTKTKTKTKNKEKAISTDGISAGHELRAVSTGMSCITRRE